jgi:hypothetical protein
MNLATFLIGMVGPLAARVLLSLGLSLVSMVGLGAGVAALRTVFIDAANTMPASALQLAGLFGIWYCAGIWFGAATFVVTWAATKGAWTLAKS